jgi:hypothetical protein
MMRAAPLGRGLPLAVPVYLVGCVALIAAAGAPFAYPLDDSYIQLAMTRTLAMAGVWGIEPSTSAAASSTPLWIVLLAAVYKIWPTRWIEGFLYFPLALDAVFSVAVIYYWNRLLAHVPWREAWLLLLWLAIPLSALTIIGMEHPAHILLVLMLAHLGAQMLASDRPPTGTQLVELGVVTLLAVGIRYESLFVAAPLMGLALLRRRPRTLAVLAIAGAAPVLAFGAYWIGHGGWLLPNSLMLKGIQPGETKGVGSFVDSVLHNFVANLHSTPSGKTVIALGLIAAGLALAQWRRRRTIWDYRLIFAFVSLVASGIEFAIAALGWLYRYEAWLIALLGVSSILLADALFAKRRGLLALVFGVLLVAVLPRAVIDNKETVEAVNDRRLEHVLISQFIHDNYRGRSIALNDIGVAAYDGDAEIFDISGLGDNDPVRMFRQPGGYTAADVERLANAKHAEIAVLQLCWEVVERRLPRDWRLIGFWYEPRNVVFGSHDVGFYAITPGSDARLEAALKSFKVPPSIEVVYPGPRPYDEAFKALVRKGCPKGENLDGVL